MEKSTIIVNNLSKVYQIYNSPKDRLKEIMSNGKRKYSTDFYALKDISFSINEGEILGIIGVNGSGKSTLLKIITGVLRQTQGEVSVHGKISALLELGAGFNPEYTGIENIYFNGMVMGFSRKEMNKKVQGIIDFADIGDYINQPVRTYSSGMVVRLAYAVAVSIEPDILIVDEALAVGDAYFQMKSMTKMQELFNKGKTVIFVSHDTATVKSLCSKVLYLDKGKMVMYGDTNEVVEAYEKKARESMSNTKGKIKESAIMKTNIEEISADGKLKFLTDDSFSGQVSISREGNGKARVRALQLLDEEEKDVFIVEFGQKYTIRVHIEFIDDCSVSIGYHIRNARNIPILGSNTVYEGIGEIEGKQRDRIIVDFVTEIPLRDGRYNIMTVISNTIIANRSSEIVDITKDGKCFDVLERKPDRVWNEVQIENKVRFWRSGNEN